MRLMLCAVLVAALAGAALADWPQFGGPTGNFIAGGEKNLARTWPEGGPKRLWSLELGVGYGGPAIFDGKVFVLDRVKDAQDVLRCIDIEKGAEEWSVAYNTPGHFDHNGSRSTPAVDARYVFTIGPAGDLYCVDRKTHKPVWHKQLVKDFGGKVPQWAISQSPTLYKDFVIVAPCGADVGVVAYRKATGAIAWKTPAIGALAYNSPVIATIDQVDQVLVYGGTRPMKLVGVKAATGEVLWSYGKWNCAIPIANPTSLGDGRVFLSTGYNTGSVMIRLEHTGGKWSASELWRVGGRTCGSQIHDAIFWKDHLYVDSNENGRNDGLVCLDPDGKAKWTANNPSMDRGGQLIADGLLYKMDGSGTLLLIDPKPEKFTLLAKAKVLDGRGGEAWATMAISDGKLVVRDQRTLRCLDVKAEK